MLVTNLQALQLLHRIQAQLLQMGQQLDLVAQGDYMIDPTIAAVISQIDTATNAIAARIQTLIDAATKAGSATAAEIVAALQPEVAKLQALGADPANPVPAA